MSFFFLSQVRENSQVSETKVRRSRQNNIISDAESNDAKPLYIRIIQESFPFYCLHFGVFDGMLFVLWIKVIYKMEFACVLSYLDI